MCHNASYLFNLFRKLIQMQTLLSEPLRSINKYNFHLLVTKLHSLMKVMKLQSNNKSGLKKINLNHMAGVVVIY